MPKKIKTKVAGVTFEGRQKIIKKHVRAGKSLQLIREPNNPHSRKGNATGIWIVAKKGLFGGQQHLQIGYLNSDLAEEIAPLLDAKWRYSCYVSAVTGGTRQKKTRGVNVHITLAKPE